jgi:DNA-binding MarR family transcriptional regulator
MGLTPVGTRMLGIHNQLQKSIKRGVFPYLQPMADVRLSDALLHPTQQADLLLFRLYRIQATASVAVLRVCEQEAGLTRREWRVLAFVVHNEGVLSSELAEKAMLDRARTSRALTALENKQLVERRPRPSNRREVQVFATDSGRAIHARLFARVTRINQALLQGFSDTECRQLGDMLARLQVRAAHVAQKMASSLP